MMFLPSMPAAKARFQTPSALARRDRTPAFGAELRRDTFFGHGHHGASPLDTALAQNIQLSVALKKIERLKSWFKQCDGRHFLSHLRLRLENIDEPFCPTSLLFGQSRGLLTQDGELTDPDMSILVPALFNLEKVDGDPEESPEARQLLTHLGGNREAIQDSQGQIYLVSLRDNAQPKPKSYLN